MKLSTEERETKTLNPETLDDALQQIRMNGYVVFHSVLSEDLVDELRTHYMELLNENIAKNEPNRGAKRWQMHLPFRSPFNHPDVISHPIVLSVIDQLLGETVSVTIWEIIRRFRVPIINPPTPIFINFFQR